MAKVLKIDVQIDESGQARRAAGELETGLQKVGQTAKEYTKEAVERLDKAFAETEKTIDQYGKSVERMNRNAEAAADKTARQKGALDDLMQTIGAYISVRGIVGAITSTAAW